MELISPPFLVDFREYCVSYMILRQINDVFSMAKIKPGQIPLDRAKFISGQRRTLVEEYYATINWQSEADVNKFLKVIGYAIAQANSDEERKVLKNLCEREGFILDGISVYQKTSKPSPRKVDVPIVVLTKFKERLIELSKLAPQPKGFAFEKFLNDLFDVHKLMEVLNSIQIFIYSKQNGKQGKHRKMIYWFLEEKLKVNLHGLVVYL
jgi:hypothetical protein